MSIDMNIPEFEIEMPGAISVEINEAVLDVTVEQPTVSFEVESPGEDMDVVVPVSGADGQPGEPGQPGPPGQDSDDIQDMTLIFENGLI